MVNRAPFCDIYAQARDNALRAGLPKDSAHEQGLFAVYLAGKAAARRKTPDGTLFGGDPTTVGNRDDRL